MTRDDLREILDNEDDIEAVFGALRNESQA